VSQGKTIRKTLIFGWGVPDIEWAGKEVLVYNQAKSFKNHGSGGTPAAAKAEAERLRQVTVRQAVAYLLK
jgi:hypothetical protein